MAEMSEGMRNALGMATGIVFGALLQRGGLADSRTIIGQLHGDDSRVAKTMATAVAVAALGHRWLHRRGLATAEPKPMNPVGLVGGAAMFGAGIALSGYCPGTAAAAAGSGKPEGAWAMAGMLAAATAFVATYPRLKKTLEAGSMGRVTLAGGNRDIDGASTGRRGPPERRGRLIFGEPEQDDAHQHQGVLRERTAVIDGQGRDADRCGQRVAQDRGGLQRIEANARPRQRRDAEAGVEGAREPERGLTGRADEPALREQVENA